MGKPDYFAPQTVQEALETLAKQPSGAKIIAGGTDLVPRMRSGILNPALLVDLCRLPLNRIEIKSGLLHIGARVTHSDILESDLLAVHCPTLVEAAKSIAGPPIRNRGTIGGNIINASPAADLAPPLLVYDAMAVLVKTGAERVVPLADLFTGPGRTILSPDEILTEICIPLPPP
ncbi:MAG TPA: FAD binding domain-containing protein, partial [Anaerolineales bacterium]